MMAVITGTDTLISALIGFAVLLLTTLGPKLISFTADWLDSHDKGKHQPQTSSPPPSGS
jgi:hypothetical protein